MNKKIPFAIFAIIVVTSLLTVAPVHAYQYYHGYTGSVFERGSGDGSGWYNWTSRPNEGHMSVMAQYGTGPSSAWSYMNSYEVEAVADVSSIRVIVFWEDGWETNFFGLNYAKIEVKLYVDYTYQDIVIKNFDEADGYEYFDFSGLDVDEGDTLDIDLLFVVSASIQSVGLGADFTYVAYTTE